MRSSEMLALLRDVHRDKAAMREAHAAAARVVEDYDFNNTYQYVIAREDMHVRWLVDAIADLGGVPDDVAPPGPSPQGRGAEVQRQVIESDRDAARRFIEHWRTRVDALPNARHRSMLHVILGETLEHMRFFEMALAGRTDLLGRRADGAGTGGGVLATRWLGGEKA